MIARQYHQIFRGEVSENMFGILTLTPRRAYAKSIMRNCLSKRHLYALTKWRFGALWAFLEIVTSHFVRRT
jgi:hypothetical protein